eukprot:m.620578 g.620578  ORF g.620578 m.620578 type:complete len:1025 (+) comp22537_c0_seq2:1108-4182(+)
MMAFRGWHADSMHENVAIKKYSATEIVGKLLEQRLVHRVGHQLYTLGASSAVDGQDKQPTRPSNIRKLFQEVNQHGGKKGGVVVTWECPSVIPLNQRKKGYIVVKNLGSITRSLVSVKFMRHACLQQFEHVQRSVADLSHPPMVLEPQHTVRIPVRLLCQQPTDFLGMIQVQFKTFDIGIQVNVNFGSADVRKELEPVGPYTPKRRQRKTGHLSDAASGTSGSRPSLGGKAWKRNCGDHHIPTEFSRDPTLALSKDAMGQYVAQLLLALHRKGNDTGLPNLFPVYSALYSRLLHVEEVELHRDLAQYNIEDAVLGCTNKMAKLVVPGLMEGRPSVLFGDEVRVTVSGLAGTHTGFVHQVERDRILLSFHDTVMNLCRAGNPVSVSFVVNRTLLRIQHECLLSGGANLMDTLFPHIDPDNYPRFKKPTGSEDVVAGLNAQQSEAVWDILSRYHVPHPYVIYGPPGTGKTRTLAAAIVRATTHNNPHIRFSASGQPSTDVPRYRVLACAPSNAAADVLCERMCAELGPSYVLRLMAYSRNPDTCPPAVYRCCVMQGGRFRTPSLDELQRYAVIVSTVSTASKLYFSINADASLFDMLAIDEAGYTTEPEVVAVVRHLHRPEGQLVLAGDPMQLGPVVRSQAAIKYGLGVSLLERLCRTHDLYRVKGQPVLAIAACESLAACKAEHEGTTADVGATVVLDPKAPCFATKLVHNYRSHPRILAVPSKLFYGNDLVAASRRTDEAYSLTKWPHLKARGFPVIFHGVHGRAVRESHSPSWFNVEEIEVVQQYVEKLLATDTVEASDIGIIAPYFKQVKKIQKMLTLLDMPHHDVTEIKVGSTEMFQGDERRVIIVTTVRAQTGDIAVHDAPGSLGFVAEPKRFNVAITRAKSLLVVVGHPDVLCTDPNWKEFVDMCLANGAYDGAPPSIPPADDGAGGAPGVRCVGWGLSVGADARVYSVSVHVHRFLWVDDSVDMHSLVRMHTSVHAHRFMWVDDSVDCTYFCIWMFPCSQAYVCPRVCKRVQSPVCTS